jgi:hypothetical protein
MKRAVVLAALGLAFLVAMIGAAATEPVTDGLLAFHAGAAALCWALAAVLIRQHRHQHPTS